MARSPWPLLLLLSAPALGARNAEPVSDTPVAPCPYFHFDLQAKNPPPPQPLPPAECAFMKSLEKPFALLAARGNIETGKVSLIPLVLIEASFNASANPDGDKSFVLVNDKFVSCLKSDRDAAIGILAHELGHVVQRGQGEWERREQVWEDPAKSEQDKLAYNRGFESQADSIGRDLLLRAGFSLDFTRVEAAAMRCSGGDFRLTSEHTHPSDATRWLQALKEREGYEQRRAQELRKAIRARARLLQASYRNEASPFAAASSDDRSPLEWALKDEKAEVLKQRPAYRPSRAMDQFDAQGLTTDKPASFWRRVPQRVVESAAPPELRDDPALSKLSLPDRLALRAGKNGAKPASYSSAVLSGAWDWGKELAAGLWSRWFGSNPADQPLEDPSTAPRPAPESDTAPRPAPR